MDLSTDLATARLIRFLEREPVIWLSTVAEDGAPHLVPTWFVWDGEHITIVSKPGARKASHIAAEPRVMLALGDAEDDFDVGLLRARGAVDPAPTPPTLPPGFLEKYGSRIAGLGLTPAQFAQTYALMIHLTPVKALGWHGRTTPSSVLAAAAAVSARRATTLAEPIRLAIRGLLGEPMARPVAAAAR
jgi:PPOX class probable F420-dependent enzyme